jgi:hypothetical protein
LSQAWFSRFSLLLQFSCRGLTDGKAIRVQIGKELLNPVGIRLGGRLETILEEGQRLTRVGDQVSHGGLASGSIFHLQ